MNSSSYIEDIKDCLENTLEGILTETIHVGDIVMMENCLEHGKNICKINVHIPWTAAIESKNLTIINRLIAILPHLEKQEYFVDLYLSSIHLNNPIIINNLISMKIPLEGPSKYNILPLQKAILDGSFALYSLLIDNVNVDAVNEAGESALFTAVFCNKSYVAGLLLEKGCDPNIATNDGQTPLMIATQGSDCFQLLLDYGANCNAKDTKDYSVLHYACLNGSTNVKNIELLLNKKVELNTTNVYLKTPLHLAAKAHYPPITNLLLKGGAAVDPEDEEGNTPLLVAMKVNDIESIKILVKNKASVIQKNKWGDSPLTLAYNNKCEEAIYILLQNGASVLDWPYECTFLNRNIINRECARVIAVHLVTRAISYSCMMVEIQLGNPHLHDMIRELHQMRENIVQKNKTLLDLLIEPVSSWVKIFNHNSAPKILKSIKAFPIYKSDLLIKYEIAWIKLGSKTIRRSFSRRKM